MSIDFEEVRRRVTVLGYCQQRGISLRRTGRGWIGRCPIHQERNGHSFVVCFTVERKSIPDLVSCCMGENRQRFEKELHRLRGFRFRRLVAGANRAATAIGNMVNALLRMTGMQGVPYSQGGPVGPEVTGEPFNDTYAEGNYYSPDAEANFARTAHFTPSGGKKGGGHHKGGGGADPMAGLDDALVSSQVEMNKLNEEFKKLGSESEMAAKASENAAAGTSDAVTAAKGAYSSAAQVPYIGWIIAPFAAAAAFAGVEAFGSAAGGAVIPPGTNPPMQLHPNEMVLPANFSRGFQQMFAGGGYGGGGNTANINMHMQSLDPRSMSDIMHANHDMITNVVARGIRGGLSPYTG